MFKCLYINICLFVAILGCSSCLQQTEPETVSNITSENSHPLYNYVKLLNKGTRGDDSYSIKPIAWKGDTVMFLAQYNDGWELFSADKR